MTTASYLAFSTMEIPAMEDSMEMASPYQGQADDFDIDIDLMEDQVSNMDSDMMGADDYPNTSQASLFNADVNDDADMADGPSEGSMVDADLVDEDPDVDVQDEEATYEADMLEGDQAEELDLPVPSIHIEVQAEIDENKTTAHGIPTETDEVQHHPACDDPASTVSESAPVLNNPEESQFQGGIALASGDDERAQSQDAKGDEDAEAPADHVNIEPSTSHESTESTAPASGEANEVNEHGDTSTEYPKGDGLEQEVQSTAHETSGKNSEPLEAPDSHQIEAQAAFEEDEPLHPVKVLYQEAEISLFPPMEGDSAETFFLHDEEVAYDNIGKLFSSLREVLLGNVAENEVLVIDIDSLGIQLTEDSAHTSHLTLHQILNIYLRLCHNDGNNEPEALYLTLSSRMAVHAELAALEAAANEGKGLSQVHPWSEFEDGEDDENLQVAKHSIEDANGVRDHPDSISDEVEGTNGEPVVPSSSAKSELYDGTTEDAEAASTEIHGTISGEHEVPIKADGGAAKPDDLHETSRAGAPLHANENAHEYEEDDHDEQYDSEAPITESTATIVPTSDHSVPTQPVKDNLAEAGEDSLHKQDADHREGSNPADNVEDLDDEQSSEQRDTEAFQGQADELYHEDLVSEQTLVTEVNADAHAVDSAPVHDQGISNELDIESVAVDVLHDEVDGQSDGQSESTVHNASQQELTTHERATTPEEDLLEAAEDHLETSAEDPQDNLTRVEGADAEQDFEAGQAHTSTAHSATAEDDLDDDESGDYDEDSYNILEFSEHVESTEANSSHTDPQIHDNPSKRSREEDDEWDFEEVSTSETKRRRPS